MRHIVFKQAERYDIAILIKDASFNERELRSNYVEPLIQLGLPEASIIAFTLEYGTTNKPSNALIKSHLADLLDGFNELGIRYLYVADANYFKVLTGQGRADPHFGYVLPCKIKNYEHLQVVLGLNYQQLIYNPALQTKLDLSLATVASAVQGTYTAIGSNIIHSTQYPNTDADIEAALQRLYAHPILACDIETFSLDLASARIGTIAFAWDRHNGIAFACDCKEPAQDDPFKKNYYHRNHAVRALLREFFQKYSGQLIFHNASFDVKMLIAELWMEDLLDTGNLLKGLKVMTRRWHDTKLIAYLATNSTAGNTLGLKALAHEFAGNWAVEVSDIRSVPLDQLLQYNLIDALSTMYVFDTYYPRMVQDRQETLYQSLMLPTQKLIVQLELTGMPLDQKRVQITRVELETLELKHFQALRDNPVIKVFDFLLQTSEMEKANAKLKVKQHSIDKFNLVAFNPNSGPQVQRLLYEHMGLPVLDYTDTRQPATGIETLEKLIHHCQEPRYKEILEALIGFSKVTKILSTFIPAFEGGISKPDGSFWLHGSFNLGGTVSGRLSSSNPNLHNLPAGNSDNALKALLGKKIKECVVAPEGWLFCGADFNSLEDYISALTTKDPNKLKVYTDGYDGHCLRAFSYYRDQMPDITDDLASINSIKKKYQQFRQLSKTITFALTYGGTAYTLMNNSGLSEKDAKRIEASYHDLYKVSDQYVQSRLQQATIDGYVDVAFGLRVRTPLLSQVVYGAKGMPFEAAAEGRTAGNALGQSYGLLNNRAAVEFFEKVWASKYCLDIKPVTLIHDAIYILVKNDVGVVEWANRELIKSMQWQELPELQHPTVKLNAALDIYWPSWAHSTTLPNNADQATIRSICDATKQTLRQAA